MPGLFSQYGALGNPLFDVIAAGQAGSNLARSNLEQQRYAGGADPQQMRFEAAAEQAGFPVMSLPRDSGPFGRLLENWHLLSPDIKARAQDYLAMEDDLTKKRKGDLDALKSAIDLREGMTGDEWKATMAGPAGKTIAQAFGGVAPDLTGPSLSEQAAAMKQQEMDLTKQRIETEKTNAELSRRRLEWELKKPPKGSPEDIAATEAEAKAHAKGAVEGFTEEVGGSWANEDAKLKVARFDRNTWGPIDRSKYGTPSAADSDPNVVRVPASKAPMIDEARSARKMINDYITFLGNSDVLVDEKAYGANTTALKAAVLANGFKIDHWSKVAGDPVTLKAYNGNLLNALQQLQPHVRTSKFTMENVQASLPVYTTDTKQQAIKKLQAQIGVIGEGIEITSKAEDKAYMESEARAFVVEEEMSTPPPTP